MITQGSPVRNLCACLTMDSKLCNVVQLGIAFMLVFSAFNTSSFIEEIVVDQLSKNTTGGVTLNPNAGYYSLSIIYGVFTVSNFVAAPIVVALTAKWAMVLGALCYASFMLMFVIYLSSWILYLMSAVLGFGAAIIWTGQGNYLTLNSTSDTIGRNSGILWALLQICLPVGGIFLYFELGSEKVDLPMHTIKIVYTCFTAIACVGVILLALLSKPKPVSKTPSAENLVTHSQGDTLESGGNVREPDLPPVPAGFKSDLIDTFRLLMTKDMQLLSVVFFYSGIELTFWSGVYSTCLGRTTSFQTSSNRLLAFNGIFIGFGEILGGGSFGLLGKYTSKYGRNPIILLGTVLHVICFFLIYLNIPMESPIMKTDAVSYFNPNEYLAMLCSFMLGLADSCWNTQLYAILGSLYPTKSAPAFALFKFWQSLAAAISFFYSSTLLLQWQLLILVIFCFLGAICFMPIEWKAQRIALEKRS